MPLPFALHKFTDAQTEVKFMANREVSVAVFEVFGEWIRGGSFSQKSWGNYSVVIIISPLLIRS